MKRYLKKFEEHLLIGKNQKPGTAKVYLGAVKHFIKHIEGEGLSSDPEHVQRSDIDDWVVALFTRYKNMHSSTRATKLSGLKTFFKFLVYKRIIDDDPSEGVPTPRFNSPIPSKFTTEELSALFAAPDIARPAGVRDLAILMTLYATGVRVSELCGLRFNDVTDTGGYIRIKVMGKGGKERIMTMRKRAAAKLRQWMVQLATMPDRQVQDEGGNYFVFVSLKLKPSGLGVSRIQAIMKKYARLAEIKSRSFPHKMRSTWATEMYDSGTEVLELARLGGWASVEQVNGYVAISESAIRKAALPDSRLAKILKASEVEIDG